MRGGDVDPAFGFGSEALGGVADFGVVHVHAVALVVAVGDGEHDAAALGVDVGSAEGFGVDGFEGGEHLRVGHHQAVHRYAVPVAELQGDQGFQLFTGVEFGEFLRGLQDHGEHAGGQHEGGEGEGGAGHGFRFKIQDSRCKVQDARFKIQDSRCKVQDSRFKGHGAWGAVLGAEDLPQSSGSHSGVTRRCRVRRKNARKTSGFRVLPCREAPE